MSKENGNKTRQLDRTRSPQDAHPLNKGKFPKNNLDRQKTSAKAHVVVPENPPPPLLSGTEIMTYRHYIMVDTNVLIEDPNAIDVLREGNVLAIAIQTIIELDNLKSRREIGYEAREALRKIKKLRDRRDPTLIIEYEHSFNGLKLDDHAKPDHIILATFNKVLKKYAAGYYKNQYWDFVSFKFITNDVALSLIAENLIKHDKVVVEDYKRDKVDIEAKPNDLPRLRASFTEFKSDDKYFIPKSKSGKALLASLKENEGVVCVTNLNPHTGLQEGKFAERFAAYKKGERFLIINPKISVCGVAPFSNGHGYNWHQALALAQMLDPTIQCVFLQGPAGTGKTLLAIAACFEQSHLYGQKVVMRPLVHLADEDNMGFLPGNEQAKLAPWMLPIFQNLSVLKLPPSREQKAELSPPKNSKPKQKGKKKSGQDFPEKSPELQKVATGTGDDLIFVSLDYIRGTTFFRNYMIIDEAQNLTPHQIKTIITRAGKGTKIIFTGDLGQIDRKMHASGLAYAIEKLSNEPIIATVNFQETVRSELAALAEKKM